MLCNVKLIGISYNFKHFNNNIKYIIEITLDFCLMHFLWKSELQSGISMYASIELALFICRTLKLPTNDPTIIFNNNEIQILEK